MKIRTDYVTNSSSSCYVVRNITDNPLNMLDLLNEAASGEWWLVSWPQYNKGSDHTQGYEDLEPKEFKSRQEFLQAVASSEYFPPGVDVEIAIAWGDGGPIFMPEGGLYSRTRSFVIEDLGMC